MIISRKLSRAFTAFISPLMEMAPPSGISTFSIHRWKHPQHQHSLFHSGLSIVTAASASRYICRRLPLCTVRFSSVSVLPAVTLKIRCVCVESAVRFASRAADAAPSVCFTVMALYTTSSPKTKVSSRSVIFSSP